MSAVSLYHEVSGATDAPVVVLSNSLGSTLQMWERQVGVLSTRYRVVRYDTRGHGRSPVPDGPYSIDDLADDLLALLDSHHVERAHLVGLSLGGMAGMRLAARDPGRVVSLAVLCTSARLEPTRAWLERAAVVRAEGSRAVAEAVVSRWYTAAFHQTEPGRVSEARAMVTATPAEGYAACCEAIAGMDLRRDLAAIEAPVLAVAGEDDPATPPEHLERIAQGVRAGRLVVVPRSAHLANDEQPNAVNAVLLEHLARATIGVSHG
ncbi:3-oxoadipate enol-lactonase [Micromonospora sp. WMMD558]|uniref:3-oxoadipate enol-lactonase n=1 Tax=unclassified Micromonospora TaxID=2617518 RepID=UPI0012B4B38D|nr:3-oxoadipate enol-lactonase [Micromonospora sp. WMMC415]QGN49221.1 3-oxoadipate enol-lactonase [Micromonospora sp. WMMC415]